jgi:predicted nuclease of predicted toxin-antitoxin system
MPSVSVICPICLGSTDPDILAWAERENRGLVTRDWNTMPGYLQLHLAAGHHSPGVLILRSGHSLPQMVFALALVAHASDPDELRDHYRFIP